MVYGRKPTDFGGESAPEILGGKRLSTGGKVRTGKGPQFLRFVAPIIEVLQSLGGSGSPREVTDAVIAALAIPEQEQRITLKNGTSRITNQVHWARFYLAKDGCLRASERGVWTLTERGLAAKLREGDVYELFKRIQDSLPKSTTKALDEEKSDADAEEKPPGGSDSGDYKTQLMGMLLSLPPNTFGMICQRLLREA